MKSYHWFWAFWIVLFVFMGTQAFFPIAQVTLKGYQAKSELEEWTNEAWLEGDYQNMLMTYVDEHFPQQAAFVKLHHQLEYTLYKNVHARRVVLGKEGILNTSQYILNYKGVDFKEEAKSKVLTKIKQLKVIQDSLKHRGKHFVLMIAPSKAWFYPNHFPIAFDTIEKQQSIYEFYVDHLDAYQVNYLDMNKWFMEEKDQSAYPLYTDLGIHWSHYGAVKVIDSLIHYLEHQFHKDLAEIKTDQIKYTEEHFETDKDIAEALNLIFPLKAKKAAYPFTHFEAGKDKLNGLFIGDSFFWTFYNRNFTRDVFEKEEFWYYWRECYQKHSEAKLSKEDRTQFKERIDDKDLVLLMATEISLEQLSWGFVEAYYDELTKEKAHH